MENNFLLENIVLICYCHKEEEEARVYPHVSHHHCREKIVEIMLFEGKNSLIPILCEHSFGYLGLCLFYASVLWAVYASVAF